jgi:8-oxo-dGTP pyrophosphatase MutT (NUDIX family)
MSTPEYPDAPLIAVGAVVVRDSRVLLVRRGQPPSEGLWAIPGGRVELGERPVSPSAPDIRFTPSMSSFEMKPGAFNFTM